MTIRSRASALILLAILAVGAVVNRAAIRGPLALDDFAQRAMIEGTLTPKRSAFNLYDFVSDDNRASLLDRGAIPFWSDPHLVVRFLRPLSSALVWLDHRLLGYGALGPHVFSLLWWAGAVLAAHALYRATLGPRPALVATLVLALSPTLAIPLVWLANRDVLLTLTFGALALTLYARWRRDRRPPMGIAAAAAFGASALTGEYALCLAAYVVAFEICQRDEPWRRRVVGALPAAMPLLLYAIAHAALGYGAIGSGFYRDPSTDPVGYLRTFPRAISVLLALAWFDVDETSAWLESDLLFAIVSSSAVVLLIGAVWTARRRRLASGSGGASWLACGSMLALIPLAAAEPSRRILSVSALGLSGVIGFLIVQAARSAQWPPRPALLAKSVAAVAIAYVHLIFAPLETRRLSRTAVEAETLNFARFATLQRGNRAVDSTLVLRANFPPSVFWAPFLLRDHAPGHWRVLSQTFARVAAIRTAARSIELAAEEGPLFPVGPGDIFRTIPFRSGETVDLGGFRATVLRVDEGGRPVGIRYEFDRDIDSAGVAWIAEGRSGFVDVVPPPVGIGVRLAP